MQQFLLQNSGYKLGTIGLLWFSKWIPRAAALGSWNNVIIRPCPTPSKLETEVGAQQNLLSPLSKRILLHVTFESHWPAVVTEEKRVCMCVQGVYVRPRPGAPNTLLMCRNPMDMNHCYCEEWWWARKGLVSRAKDPKELPNKSSPGFLGRSPSPVPIRWQNSQEGWKWDSIHYSQISSEPVEAFMDCRTKVRLQSMYPWSLPYTWHQTTPSFGSP